MRRLFGFPWRTRRDIEADVEAEIAFHLEARAEELVEQGVAPAAARAQAEHEFGDVEDARRYIRAQDRATEAARRRRDHMGELRQDVVYAFRRLRSSPAFAVTAVLTLALGIGANAAIFSVVYGVLFRPLPFPDADHLYRAWSANRTAGALQVPVSSPDLDDWRAQRRQIEDLGGYWYADEGSGIDLTGSGEPRRLSVAFVTAGFFDTFGVPALHGRLPREDELVRGGRDRVVMLTHGFWQREFGGKTDVIGQSLILSQPTSSGPYEVLGVMPPGFRYPSERVDIFLPYSSIPDESIPHIRPVRILSVVARARPGVGPDVVRDELNTIAVRLAQQYPENASYDGATIEPLQDAMTGPVRAGLLVLLGAVAFVLLMTCANIASLLLARATTRGREIVTRMALGAGRGRIVRQLLTESVVLALVGGVAGIGVAYVTLAGLLRLSAGQLPRGSDIRLDATVLLFALALSVATGILFGLVPALRGATRDLQGALREGGRGLAGGEARRLRSALVVVEVALAVMLVVGAGLMTRSFLALMRVDPGFRAEQLLAINFTINTVRHPDGQHRIFYQRVIETVRELPGVVSAGAVKDAPFRGEGERWSFRTPGMVVPAGEDPPNAMVLHVSDGYFRTIGTPILDGREFAPRDRADAPFAIVVNEALARQYFPGESAVGRPLRIGEQEVPIVGVVGDIRQSAIAEPGTPTIYVDNQQNTRVKVTLVVRTRGEPLALAEPVEAAIRTLDPDQTITSVFTYEDIVSEALARPRLLTVLLAAFGVLGLVLGALGIYGVQAYLVGQRQREIGVRMALGARPRAVLGMVVARGLTLSVAGIAIGLAGAFALTRYLRAVLFGIAPTDPLTFAAVGAVLLAVGLFASWLPARRAAGVDPITALRAD
jgi:predicted permease